MALTDSIEALASYVYDKITASMEDLGVTAVFYGDQDLLPSSPCVCIETDDKVRVLRGATRRTDNTFTIYVLVYHSEVRSPQSNRQDADRLAEAIEAVLHLDPTLGTQVQHSYVTQLASGYVRKGGQLMRSSRLTFEAKNTTQLPPSP